jgi:hypothetical protein
MNGACGVVAEPQFDARVLPSPMFNFGRPKTAGDWIVHLSGAVIALFLIWWMLHAFLGI